MRYFLFIFMFLGSFLWAGGLQLYEVSTPGLGAADVGQAAISSDPSISYFNPAGMTKLKKSELLLGAQLIAPNIEFKKENITPILGNNGGQAGIFLPTMGVYFVGNVSEKVKIGFNINSPHGSGLDYGKKWTGRYLIERVLLLSLDVNPSIGIEFAKWFSIGAGIVLEYGVLHEKVAISPVIFHEPFGAPDGELQLKQHDFALGFNAGVLFSFSKTKLGISYRSQIKHDFKGKVKVFPIGANFALDTLLKFPQNIMISLYQPINKKLAFMFDLGWQEWKVLDSIVVSSDREGKFNIPRNWKNVWHYGVATQYNFTKKFLWQFGYAYDTSPTEAKRRTPDMPLDRQNRFGTGFIYHWKEDISFSSAFEYLDGGNSKINLKSLKGKYKSLDIFFVNFTFSKKF
jgi:long-chain fatty acid transport protein